MTTLKKARDENKLEEFIKEHEKDESGDKDKLQETIRRFVPEKSKSTPETSEKD